MHPSTAFKKMEEAAAPHFINLKVLDNGPSEIRAEWNCEHGNPTMCKFQSGSSHVGTWEELVKDWTSSMETKSGSLYDHLKTANRLVLPDVEQKLWWVCDQCVEEQGSYNGIYDSKAHGAKWIM